VTEAQGGGLFDWAESYAWVSADQQYRYTLGRVWDPRLPMLTFGMLNPSKADAKENDPTIIKCRGFATRLGFGGIHVVNLFAFRATKPAAMWAARKAGVDIVGPENDDVLREAFSRGDAIAAWGANGAADPLRVQFVTALARAAGCRLQALSVTKAGDPGHPLMLPYSSVLRPWPKDPS
jgi:hypothetical protein